MYERNKDGSKKRVICPDPSLLKAGRILTKTYKKQIYNKNCLEEPDIKEMNKKPIPKKKPDEEAHGHGHGHHDFNPKSNYTPYILLIALSIHGLFEGIALGIQGGFSETLTLGIAIVSHKWAESFTLGISFFRGNTEDNLYRNLIIIFSCFTPIGIVIGMFLMKTTILIEAIFLSLSGGTFLYIAASEVIVEEFSVTKYKVEKFIMFLIGALFIAILAYLEDLFDVDG